MLLIVHRTKHETNRARHFLYMVCIGTGRISHDIMDDVYHHWMNFSREEYK